MVRSPLLFYFPRFAYIIFFVGVYSKVKFHLFRGGGGGVKNYKFLKLQFLNKIFGCQIIINDQCYLSD